jgi:alpha-beta hydrolase superfamily lysophospholipase
MRDTRIAGAAVRILEPTRLPVAGSAVVLHGLASNRVFMQQLGQWLAAQGFRVYLVDAPGHGATPGHFTHLGTLESSIRVLTELQRSGQNSGGHNTSLNPFSAKAEPALHSGGLQVEPAPVNPQTTIIVGHSMGGEIAIRLADYFPVAATIAFAPAPMVLPRRMPSNLLIISAQLDLTPIKTSAEQLLRAAGGSRTAGEDFRQRRAANRIVAPWTAHGSVVVDSLAARAMAGWARDALGLMGPPEPPRGEPLVGEILGIAGICLLFPLTATLIVRTFRANSAGEKPQALPSTKALLVRWILAALLALSIVTLWYPQRIFPFYGGGYLAFFMLLAGISLAVLFRQHLRGVFDRGYRPVLAASALGSLIIFGLGAWLDWQLTDVRISGVRWFYFVPLFLANLPYAIAEEAALGAPERSRRAGRFGTFVALRFVLLIALLAGILIFLSGQVLMALLAPTFVAVSLGQRLGADSLRRRTGSPAAAAIFSAILAAWFMAAVFPLA